MSAMSIPPFPSLDLAKLVLGYLAEEQLMTAYDEFLQASPYLDALRNEYDRIFMTSLKNILAEYRAVKIYVETCKPFALRKKLFQCTNLLDVVKFLVNHVDINKIQAQDTSNFRNSSGNPNSSIVSKSCEVCDSLKLTSCVCKSRQSAQATNSNLSTSNNELSTRDSSVEATALSDLPGNHVTTRKKHVKVLDKESPVCGPQDTSVKQSTCVFKNTTDDQNSQTLISHDNILQNVNVPLKLMDESQEKIKEFNDILHQVCNKNASSTHQGNIDRRVSNAGTFQDFASGVIGGENRNTVPDSSTSESMNLQFPVAKEKSCKGLSATTKKYRRNKKSHLIVVTKRSDLNLQPGEVIDVDAIDELPRLRPAPEQSKIKILSDVKVGNETLNSNLNAVLQNATSTPLLKMQTVLINGTPVYKPVSNLTNKNYSKAEIMAMPTIIITPVSGPASSALAAQLHQATAPSQPTVQQIANFVPVPQTIPGRSLEPLVIDVSTNNSPCTLTQAVDIQNKCDIVQQEASVQGLVTTIASSNFTKTVTSTEIVKPTDVISASVPKDNVLASTAETSTPQVLPPTRKSSSTPRRTSHVRVLDFTTPRRILHETINEIPNTNGDEIILSKSPNVSIPNTNIINDNVHVLKVDQCGDCQKKSKENNKKKIVTNKMSWDTDLRAALAETLSAPVKKTDKKRSSRKKKAEIEPKKEDKQIMSSTKKKCTKSIIKKSKKDKEDIDKEAENKDENVKSQSKKDIPIKPTINIISGRDWESSHQETEKLQNKSNPSNNDDHDTPEMDRISLDKVIGARLNISDLLETPYKQALYDIQMETPRFLGPDLPDDPMSDIKIMNIPTPRFLNSSKGAQATPSSYSSRPTDYSSGGSYYKPDDQDYMPLPEHIGCSISPIKANIESKSPTVVNEEQTEKANKSKSRPVRQCAKNVTYFKHHIGKGKEENTKELDKSIEEEFSSDSFIAQTSPNIKVVRESTSKRAKESTPKIRPKSVDKLKKSSSKKHKSPVKKEVSKSFMKIRPRRSTPMKVVKSSKKRISEVATSKSQTRKRTNSKDRSIQTASATTAAPTKSRRKSSIPRKLLCTNHSESSGHNSPDLIIKQKESDHEADFKGALDSDTEQLKLRWSDDGSQDGKPKGSSDNPTNDIEDIMKIQEYIKTTVCSKPATIESEGSLHSDLVKRGFDIETAKIIERDLLDTPPHPKQDVFVPISLESESKNDEITVDKTIESESSLSNNLQIVQDEQEVDEEEEEEEIELSVNECNEETSNYVSCYHEGIVTTEPIKLKDTFCMEVCIDDGVSIRLRPTPFITLYDHTPVNHSYDNQDIEETQRAVSSIKFQTPLKEAIKAQCYEIFDSTLTSLDTPLKVNTPRRSETEVTVTEIVLEVEKVEVKEKQESKKRKRLQSGNTSDDSTTDVKKSKTEAQYMLNSANIQNIDIESVLSKLHGP